jgi:hypothetical protein
MIPIPGWLIALVTFPGVIVHEAAHMFFCRVRGVPVIDVCFFRIGNPCGYVAHGEVKDFTSSFLISVGPFFINSLLCIVLCFPAFAPVRVFGLEDPLSYVLIYLGVSIGMHAFPSTQDAAVLWRDAKKAAGTMNPLAVLSFPVVILIYIANGLSVVWFDYIYGFAIGFLLPELLFEKLV